MWQILTSEAEVVVRGGWVYLPLQYDADIEAELEKLAGQVPEPPPGMWETNAVQLIHEGGGYFVQSLSLASLVENYAAVFPEEWEQQRLGLRRLALPRDFDYRPPLDAKLKTVLFDVLPHFLMPRRGRRGKKTGRAGAAAYVAGTIPGFRGKPARLKRLREQEISLRQVLLRLEELEKHPGPPPVQRRPGRELAGWFGAAIQAELVKAEREGWVQELGEVQDLLRLPETELNVLLDVADRKTVEVDGCGCCPDNKYPGEYLVYKRTGEYVLQDYFGRYYLFPDCRVGVSTAGPYHPMVLDMYKHPLLRRLGSRQQICLTDFRPEPEFSGNSLIRALEEGLNALYYGYNSRKRNGYTSLDTYGRHRSAIDFEDWRLAQEDPRVASGELEVKNRFV